MKSEDVTRLFKASGSAPTVALEGEPPFSTRPELIGTFGMVASSHWLATASGMAILEKGGNAFDAAVAVTFALQVVEPTMCGVGGEAPMIFCDAKTEKIHVISGQGTAPASATVAAYRDLGVEIVPGAGLLPAVVPGAFDGLMVLLRDWGSMGVADVLAPAIDYATNGYPISGRVCATIGGLSELFTDHWPSSGAVYLPGGSAPKPSSRFCNPTLAACFERLIKDAESAGGSRENQIDAARDAFYRGFVADAIDRFVAENEFLDTSGEHHGGFITGQDLAAFETSLEAPLGLDYGNFTVFKMDAWSQGPTFLQQLSMLKNFDIASMDPDGPEFVHVVTEATKLAFADREKFYGDPKFVDVPIDVLLSDEYGKERAAMIADEASGDIRPGSIPGFGGPVIYGLPDGSRVLVEDDGGTAAVGLTKAVAIPTGDTVHLDIADKDGNMISVTPSGGWLRSSPVVPELGFQLSNRGQIFTLEEGSPGALAPGKRPRTTLSPGFANRDGKPYMAFGTPGADRQDQWALQFFLRHADHGQNIQQAIDSPTFNTDHFPGSFYPKQAKLRSLSVEGRFSKETVADLEKRGHIVDHGEDWSQGRMTAVARDGEYLKSGASARYMQTYAAGR
ncbi:MAG: gamma-glutamyltransferase [Rhodospirillaceae bacterium]|nr:gamma-glutamyltransferase [Rhodospirillaceae bacterium]HAA92200.1 gamma-glutamyltransferase [Rhodospirillaceae bacterium]